MDSNTPDPLLFEKQGGHISWHPCPTLPSTSLRVETQGSFNTLTLDVGHRAGVSDGGGGALPGEAPAVGLQGWQMKEEDTTTWPERCFGIAVALLLIGCGGIPLGLSLPSGTRGGQEDQ